MSARSVVAVGVVALAALVGCSAQEPAAVETADGGVTWEEAKAAAQARELEIVALIPADQVAAVDQHETGSLFSCSETQHRWTGMTNVTMVLGADAEATTKKMEALAGSVFPEDDFEVSNYRGITDKYVTVVNSPQTGEGYLFGEGEPGTIAIDSWSVCFTLPEGTYPGGDF